jgi:hypothetical protein
MQRHLVQDRYLVNRWGTRTSTPRGQIADQQIAWFQVKLDVGFRVEDGTDLGAG